MERLPSSVLHVVLLSLAPSDVVRFASCSKSLYHDILVSACHRTLLPIMRERLKYACWSLLQAGYCIQISNTFASYISSANSVITLTYTSQMFYEKYSSTHGLEALNALYHHLTRQIHIYDFQTFSNVFDMYIVHFNARFQRAGRPPFRVKRIEKHFARCAEQFAITSAQVATSRQESWSCLHQMSLQRWH